MRERYGIAEWYGRDVTRMSTQERADAARTALAGDLPPEQRPLCPFAQPLQPSGRCSKRGGVCSIRPFREDGGRVTAVGSPVTMCPHRFRERTDGEDMFTWIGERVLGDRSPVVVKEVPFLSKRSTASARSAAGRIDWVVVPRRAERTGERWAAVETQALYFSGPAMKGEFDGYADRPESVRFPTAVRRPDFRSSGPKRLSPQLDVKAPRIGRWGQNTVVVVDEYFWEQMPGLPAADLLDVDNAEVIWVVLGYDDDCHLRLRHMVGATVAATREVLEGTEPMDRSEFTDALTKLISSGSDKVFRT